jgi:hypothetical protein
MARNKLSDLNDHLFMALERLNEEDLTTEQIDLEERRVKAISTVSHQIISASTLFYKTALAVSKGDIDVERLPESFDRKHLAK